MTNRHSLSATKNESWHESSPSHLCRKEIESEERRKEEIVEDKRRHVEHLDHRLAERAKEMADAEAEMRAAQEEAAKRKASTAELTRLEEEVEKWKRKVEEKEGEREAVIVEKVWLGI